MGRWEERETVELKRSVKLLTSSPDILTTFSSLVVGRLWEVSSLNLRIVTNFIWSLTGILYCKDKTLVLIPPPPPSPVHQLNTHKHTPLQALLGFTPGRYSPSEQNNLFIRCISNHTGYMEYHRDAEHKTKNLLK